MLTNTWKWNPENNTQEKQKWNLSLLALTENILFSQNIDNDYIDFVYEKINRCFTLKILANDGENIKSNFYYIHKILQEWYEPEKLKKDMGLRNISNKYFFLSYEKDLNREYIDHVKYGHWKYVNEVIDFYFEEEFDVDLLKNVEDFFDWLRECDLMKDIHSKNDINSILGILVVKPNIKLGDLKKLTKSKRFNFADLASIYRSQPDFDFRFLDMNIIQIPYIRMKLSRGQSVPNNTQEYVKIFVKDLINYDYKEFFLVSDTRVELFLKGVRKWKIDSQEVVSLREQKKLEICNIIEETEIILYKHPDIKLVKLIKKVLTQPTLFTIEEKYHIITKMYQAQLRSKKIKEYLESSYNNNDLVRNIIPWKHNTNELDFSLKIEQRGQSIVFFAATHEDYYFIKRWKKSIPHTNGSLWCKFQRSLDPILEWSVVLINGVWFSLEQVVKHEVCHSENSLLSIWDVCKNARYKAADEIIAYLIEVNEKKDEIYKILTKKGWLYDYFSYLEEDNTFEYWDRWKAHIKTVEEDIENASLIQEKYPDNFANQLRITKPEDWYKLL